MATNTTNINLYKKDPSTDGNDTFDIQSMLNDNWDKIDKAVGDINTELQWGASASPSLNYGMNNVIKNNGKASVIPKFTFKGEHYVNLLGKDGNCESVSNWYANNCTLTLDNSSKVLGNASFKLTATAANGYINYIIQDRVDKTKYYAVSAYLKNGNTAYCRLDLYFGVGGINVAGTKVTDTTNFNRVVTKLAPSNWGTATTLTLGIGTSSAIGQYCYVDGIMLTEITAAQYADNSYTPPPYVESYACLTNPYVEVRHDNLVRNGNGEEGVAFWNSTSQGNVNYSNTYFVVTKTSSAAPLNVKQTLKLKPSTAYAFRYVAKAGTIAMRTVFIHYDKFNNYILQTPDYITTATTDTIMTGTFTTPPNADYTIAVMVPYTSAITETGNAYVKEVMLIEGVTAPTAYKPCKIEHTVIEGQFTSDDIVTLENGKVSGTLNWKHKTLYGKDYEWKFDDDGTGYKMLGIADTAANSIQGLQTYTVENAYKVIKYDGKILPNYFTGLTSGDYGWAPIANYFRVTVNDVDSGWAESITPNADEVKAFMNGWKAMWNDGTRYNLWRSVMTNNPYSDTSAYPPGTVTTLSVATTGTTSMTVSDASVFKVGDTVALVGVTGGIAISSISANVLTMASPIGAGAIGNVVAKVDASIVNYCKNNVASGYEGYRLYYKLATPEPITDDNVHLHGDIIKLDVGDNYINIDNGIVLGEPINFLAYSYDTDNMYTNYWDYTQATAFAQLSASAWKNKVENGTIFIYENEILKLINKTQIPKISYNSNATYTVDYKILATIAPQVGLISCSYNQDLFSATASNTAALENKQNKDSTLDTLIDLSLYQKFVQCRNAFISSSGSSEAHIDIIIPYLPMKCTPVVSIGGYRLVYNGGDTTNKLIFELAYKISETQYLFRYRVTDSTILTAIKSYGFELIIYNVVFDCRGRL